MSVSSDMDMSIAGDPGTGLWTTIKKFASLCGASEKTVRRWVEGKALPFAQPGGPRTRILIPMDALERITSPARERPEPAASGGSQRRGRRPQWQRAYDEV